VPVIKMTGNSDTARLMEDNMDFDASPVIIEGREIEDMGEELFDLAMKVVNGRKSKAESLGFNDMSLARECNFC